MEILNVLRSLSMKKGLTLNFTVEGTGELSMVLWSNFLEDLEVVFGGIPVGLLW